MPFGKEFMNRYLQLIVGTLVLLFMGVAYAWSLFVAPLEEEFGWTRDETSMIFSISIIFFSVGGIAGGLLLGRMGIRKTLTMAAMLIVAGFVSCAAVSQLWQIYAMYGVCSGLGIGITYNAVITAIGSHFTDRAGFASGIALMGYGLGSFLFASMIALLGRMVGWRGTFIVFAVIFGIVLAAAAIIVKVKESGTDAEKQADAGESIQEKKQISTSEMLKSIKFYCYYIWNVSITAAGLAVVGHAALISTSAGAGISLTVIVMGMLSIANGVSRPLTGMLYDRMGRHRTLLCVTAATALGIILLMFASGTGSHGLLAAGFVFAGLGFGGVAPCNAVFPREEYGDLYYSRNFGVTCTSGITASLIGPYIMGVLMMKLGSYEYAIPFLLIFILSAAACIIALKILDRREKKMKKEWRKNQLLLKHQ